MVDKLSLLWENFSKLSTCKEREKIGDQLWFDDINLLCLVCCSWWPDSLFLAVFIYRYRHIVKWLPLSITKILHFNHTSHQCDQEASDLVTQLFWSTFEIIYWKTVFWCWKITETVLRKQRHKFYTDSIQRFYSTLQSVSLCLWHHYNDRIENSFLHMDRGSWMKWIVNMTKQEKRRFHSQWVLLPYIIFRPLLNYTKETILLLCKRLQLPFVVDVHNWDITQKRILLRKRIFDQSIDNQNLLYDDRLFIYTYFESEIKQESFFSIFTSSFWPTKQMYCANTPTSIHQLQQQLSWCGLYTNISEKRLNSLLEAFNTAQSFYLQGRWFLQRKWQTFFCFTWSNKRFWEESIDLKIVIEALWTYNLWWLVIEIEDNAMVWWEICFPKVWDKIWSVSFMKRASKQAIPFFMRRSLPIVKKNNRIEKVFSV